MTSSQERSLLAAVSEAAVEEEEEVNPVVPEILSLFPIPFEWSSKRTEEFCHGSKDVYFKNEHEASMWHNFVPTEENRRAFLAACEAAWDGEEVLIPFIPNDPEIVSAFPVPFEWNTERSESFCYGSHYVWFKSDDEYKAWTNFAEKEENFPKWGTSPPLEFLVSYKVVLSPDQAKMMRYLTRLQREIQDRIQLQQNNLEIIRLTQSGLR